MKVLVSVQTVSLPVCSRVWQGKGLAAFGRLYAMELAVHIQGLKVADGAQALHAVGQMHQAQQAQGTAGDS